MHFDQSSAHQTNLGQWKEHSIYLKKKNYSFTSKVFHDFNSSPHFNLAQRCINLEYNFSYNDRSQATMGLVNTWLGNTSMDRPSTLVNPRTHGRPSNQNTYGPGVEDVELVIENTGGSTLSSKFREAKDARINLTRISF